MAIDPRTTRDYLADVDQDGDALRVPKILFKRDNFSKITFAELVKANDDLPDQDFLDHIARHYHVNITKTEEGRNTVYYVGANVKYGQTLDALSTLFDFIDDAQSNSPRKYSYTTDTLEWYSRAKARYERNYSHHVAIPRLATENIPSSFFDELVQQLGFAAADVRIHEDKESVHLFSNSDTAIERTKHVLLALQPLSKRLEDEKRRRNRIHSIHQNHLSAAAHLRTIEHIFNITETHQADEQRRHETTEDEDLRKQLAARLPKIQSAIERLYNRDPEAEIKPLIQQLEDIAEQADRVMALIKVTDEKIARQQAGLQILDTDTAEQQTSKIKSLAALDTTYHNAASEEDEALQKLAVSSQEFYAAAEKVLAFVKQMAVDAGTPEYKAVKPEKNRHRAAAKNVKVPPERIAALISEAIDAYPIKPDDRVIHDTEDIEDDPYEITEDDIIKEEIKIHEGRQRMSKRRSEPQSEELFYHNGVNLSPLAEYFHENGQQAIVDVFANSDLIVPLKIVQHSTHAEFGFELSRTKHSNADDRFELAKSILAGLAAIGETNGYGIITDEYIADFVNAKLSARQNVDISYEEEPIGFLANYEAHDFFLHRKKNKLLSVFEDEKGIRLVPSEREGNKGFDVYVKGQTEDGQPDKRDLDEITDVSLVLELVADAHYNGKPTSVTQQKLSNWLKDAQNAHRKHFMNETETSLTARPSRVQAAGSTGLKQDFNANANYVKDIFIIPKRTDQAEQTIRQIRPANYTPISQSQDELYDALMDHNMNVVLGAAATGKTDASVSAALQKLKNGEVDKIVITRPAVEAGENLGFLPGNMQEKLDPYLQPLFDVLEKRLADGDIQKGKNILRQLMSQNIIEIVPLAFMRGRTMTKTFVIVDEAQNASIGQLKAVMTRMGPESHMMISGDKSQSDLPVGVSGLDIVADAFEGVEGFNIVRMDPKDAIARDPLVQKMVQVFEEIDLPDDAGGVVTPGFGGNAAPSVSQAGSLTSVFMSHAVPMLIQDFKDAGYSTADITKTGLEIQKMEQKGASAEDIIDYLDSKIKQKRGQSPAP